MISTWTGNRRIAFIPVWNSQIDTEPNNAMIEDIKRRLFFDPDPNTGFDRSLRKYIHTVSSGKASFSGRVFPKVRANDADTVGAGLRSLPVTNNLPFVGYDYAVIILPHGAGQHRGGFAWMGAEPVRGVSNYARVAVYSNTSLTTFQNIAVWAHEMVHILTRFGDMYNVAPNLGGFDLMAAAGGTHPSAHTKSTIGWIDENSIIKHQLRKTKNYELHAISYPQPNPPWRFNAVHVESITNSGHFIIECRLKNDEYESPSMVSSGIPSEGVIVYEVMGTVEVFLRTPIALQAGDAFEDKDELLKVEVQSNEPGGFTIKVISRAPNRCTQLDKQIKTLKTSIQLENDLQTKKQLISALVRAQNEFRRLGCVVLSNPATELVMRAEHKA